MVIAAVENSLARKDFARRCGGVKAAMWAWAAFVGTTALASLWFGAPGAVAAVGALLGVAPAIGVLLALPEAERLWARCLMPALWVGAATAAASLTGGVWSPLAVLFFVGPALSLRLYGGEAAMESTLFALTGYAMAAISSGAAAPYPAPAPGAFTLGALALAGYLASGAPVGVAPAPPPPTPASDPQLRRIAEVSHELRTPLNHIIGFADMMRQQVFGPLPAKYDDYAGLILAAGRRMLGLLDAWLDAARLAEGRYPIVRERVDLAEIAAAAVREAGAAHPDRPAPILASEGEAWAMIDPRAARQILDNLLANAFKYAPGDAARIWVRVADGKAIIEVADQGPGVPDEEKARLMQPFERGAGVGGVQGAGLGLALVRGLAQAHGGGLSVLDAPGGGALMRVTLADEV